ncbi:hypothetical protein MASR2M78_21890 [Treponema sp.]
MLDADGGELQVLPVAEGLRRIYVSAAAVPPELKKLVLRAEDRRFRLHPGVDPLALLRASIQNAGGKRTVSGASTLEHAGCPALTATAADYARQAA